MKVPPTLRFVLDGKMPPYLTAKDLILQVIGEIGVAGGTYKAMEFTGDAISQMSMEVREGRSYKKNLSSLFFPSFFPHR